MPIDIKKHSQLTINFVQGSIAPRYPKEVSDRELWCKKVVITEQGTENRLPIVDFVCEDPQGNEYFFAVTGRIVTSIAAALAGVNMRNHGTKEP